MKETKFKMTELGPVPEDWEVKTLGEVGHTFNGLSGKTKEDFGKGSASYVTFLNVLNNPVINTAILGRVSVEEGERQNAIKKGDLLFNTSSETPLEVGISSTFQSDMQNVYLNSFCFGFRIDDKECDSIFLAYFFRGCENRMRIASLANGVTRFNLSKKKFVNARFAFPPLAEQGAIAGALGDVDGLISALRKLIGKKRAVKQGVMQELLSGKRRLEGFAEPWVEKTLGEVAGRCLRGKGISKDESQTGNINAVRYGEIYTHHDYVIKEYHCRISEDVARNSQRIYKGELLFTCSGETPEDIGKCVAKCDDSLAYASGDIVIFSPRKEYDSIFLSYACNSKDAIFQKSKMATGSSIIHIAMQALSQVKILIPPTLAEQEAIARVLGDMDGEIAGLEGKLAKYEAVKAGMMQELLTGRIRLI